MSHDEGDPGRPRPTIQLGWVSKLGSAVGGLEEYCLDFPYAGTVGLYRDAARSPDGFGPGVEVFSVQAFSGSVRALDIDGGSESGRFDCFTSRGTPGGARRALQVSLGNGTGGTRVMRLIPSTGMARIV